MNILIALWQGLGQIEQGVIAVVLVKKLYNAADTCPVKKSLNSDVDVSIRFVELDR